MALPPITRTRAAARAADHMTNHFKDDKPTTLEEAVLTVYDRLDAEDLEYIREEGTTLLHHGLGRVLRNAWLWNEDHPLHQHFNTRFGLGCADDMSSMILSGVEAKAKGQLYDTAPDVERFKKHWADCGIDPLTQEPVNAGG